MHISLRSQVTAGAAAVVGASALALTPVAPAVNVPSLSQARADVALASLANPFSALLGAVGVAGSYLLNPEMDFNPPTVGAGAINWPFAGISDVMNSYLQFEGLGGYTSVGLLPQIVADSFPIATALVNNGLGYIWNTVKAAGVAGEAVGDLVWSIPTTAIAVVQDLISLDFSAAVNEITAAISNALSDIDTAGTALLGAGTYVLTGVATRAVGVLAAAVGQLPVAVIETVRQISQVVTSVIDTGRAIISSLGTLDPETVWNTAVAGLLSPAGIPGTVLNVTLGAGVQLGPVTTQESIAENFVFSGRTLAQGAVKAIAGALNTPNPAPPAAAVAASPASARAAVAAGVAPVEQAPAGLAADDSASSAATVRAGSDEGAVPAAAVQSLAGGDGAPSATAPAAAAAKAEAKAKAKAKAEAETGSHRVSRG